jgi:urease accessory protein
MTHCIQRHSTMKYFLQGAASLAAVLVFALTANDAAAHHMMGGELPGTFSQGLLSGLGHPVIGLDHLAFVVAVGLLSAQHVRGYLMPAVFLAAMIGGVGLHLALLTIPAVELAIALSVLLLGVVVAWRRDLALPAKLAIYAAAGIFHGYAYGESIVGAEPTPLAAYFAGLLIIQYAIALAAYLLGRVALRRGPAVVVADSRLVGGAIIGIGLVFLANQLVPEPTAAPDAAPSQQQDTVTEAQ